MPPRRFLRRGGEAPSNAAGRTKEQSALGGIAAL